MLLLALVCRNPSAGKVSILGHDMSKLSERAKAFDVLGVCPQVDPIWDAWLDAISYSVSGQSVAVRCDTLIGNECSRAH